MLWRDGGVLALLGVAYVIANATIILPFVIALIGIVILYIAFQSLPQSEPLAVVALGVQGLMWGGFLLISDTTTWPYLAPLAGVLVFRSSDIAHPYTLPTITGYLIGVVGISYVVVHDTFDVTILVFPIVSVLIGVLWVKEPQALQKSESPSISAAPAPITRSTTASHPSFEMPSVAPFAFDAGSDDRLDEVAQQLETISTVIGQQVNQTARQVHTVEQLGATLRESQDHLRSIRNLLQTVDGSVIDVMSSTTEGHASVKDTQRQLQQALDTVQTVGRSMAQLVADLRRVSEIVLAVSDVATQSNFLALNAQIEAARAGELGRGFTIVAEEVRDLATQSRESTRVMKSILRSIHQTSSQAVRVTETSSSEIAGFASSTEQLDQFVSAIEETINNTHRAITRVIVVIEQLQNQIEQLTSYNQQLNQQTMQSQASLLMAGNLSQSVQAILKKR